MFVSIAVVVVLEVEDIIVAVVVDDECPFSFVVSVCLDMTRSKNKKWQQERLRRRRLIRDIQKINEMVQAKRSNNTTNNNMQEEEEDRYV